MMFIDIFSDPICPWCYIGKRRLERALAARPTLGVEVRWRAFQLNPAMPQDGMERQAYLTAKFGNAAEAGRLYAHIRQVGAGEDIDFAFDRIKRTPNTINAHRLIRYAARNGKSDAVVEALFRAYFLDGRDIGARETLQAIATEAGLPDAETAAYLAGEEDLAAVQKEDMHARQIGIEGVPCFIVNEKYALSGAQEPEAFFQLFDMVAEETRKSVVGT